MKYKNVLFRYGNIMENIISLFSIKGMEYLLALITFPYLVHVLGPDKYGTIIFAQSFVQYFSLIVDYGFNLTGPRNIAASETDFERSESFISILFAKLILCIGLTIIFYFVICNIETFNNEYLLYWCAYLTVCGNVIFPVWFFQGIQKMKYITFVNIIARTLNVFTIFLFIKNAEDYVLVAFLQSIVPIVSGIISLGIIFCRYKYVFIKPTWKLVKYQFVDGWEIFISTIAINLYTASNTFFLGLLTNNTVVGYFSSASKIVESIKGLLGPISQAIYPYINSMVKKSREETLLFLRKIMFVLCGTNLIFSIILFMFADQIVYLLLGHSFEESITIVRIMAFLPFIISLSNVFGIQTMIPFGWQNLFSKVVIWSAVLNICAVFPLIYFFSANGVAMAMLLTECFVTFMCWYLLKKQGVNFLKIQLRR